MLELQKIDRSWTLFLDRDGVINVEKFEDYIYNYSEFHFIAGVKNAIRKLSEIFSTIIIVTNQRGVEKGLMTENDLIILHEKMLDEIHQSGGRIDRIYYCTSLDNNHPNRKPNAGMAIQAKKDLPGIDLAKSVMVGNKITDMQFGRNAGMSTVHVRTTDPHIPFPNPLIDMSCEDLPEFAKSCYDSFLAKS